MNKCTKFNIYITEKETKNIIYNELFTIKNKYVKSCNKCMSIQYNEFVRKYINNDKNTFKDIYGKTLGSYLEDCIKSDVPELNTGNIAQTDKFITNDANFNVKKLLKGEESLTTFKNTMPLIIHNTNYKIYKDDNGKYYIGISLFSLAKLKELGYKKGERVVFTIATKNIKGHDDKSLISTLNKLMNCEVKQGSGQIMFDTKKKKWYFTSSYSFESSHDTNVDMNRILGVDLGITKVATMSVYDIDKQQYELLNWKVAQIDGKELIHHRQKIEARRKDLAIASKWASEAKVGHGYKKRMEDANKLENKYEKFRDTYNHKISKYIVDMAIRYNCGIIQMENLSGFSSMQTESLLKNWSYYDLQSKIKYKAEQVGITTVLINPAYTSKRCSKCGRIHDENRDCKNNQAKFECVECGFKMNADVNASRNIALPNIEDLIQKEISKHKKM